MDIKSILDAIADLKRSLHGSMPEKPSRSADIKELSTALAKAQGEMRAATLNCENPYFKSSYADLSEIVKVSRPALAKNGLAVIQQILPNEEGHNVLHCILSHSSGQWIESRMRIVPAKTDIQSFASYVSYLRRYSYAALVGVVTTDEDDDAEMAVHSERDIPTKPLPTNVKYNPRDLSYEVITKEQLEHLHYVLADAPDIANQILEGYRIQSLADMPKSKFQTAINRIDEIKKVRAGK
jgi:hypothetical protein